MPTFSARPGVTLFGTSIMRSISARLRPGGFSQKTCFPASRADSTTSGMNRLGAQTMTAFNIGIDDSPIVGEDLNVLESLRWWVGIRTGY